jgi:hypothetical protein
MTDLSTDQEMAVAAVAAAAIHIKSLKGVIPMDNKLKFIGPMMFFKFTILMAIVFSLTMVKPMAIAAHNGTQKICSFIMDANDCAKHC